MLDLMEDTGADLLYAHVAIGKGWSIIKSNRKMRNSVTSLCCFSLVVAKSYHLVIPSFAKSQAPIANSILILL